MRAGQAVMGTSKWLKLSVSKLNRKVYFVYNRELAATVFVFEIATMYVKGLTLSVFLQILNFFIRFN